MQADCVNRTKAGKERRKGSCLLYCCTDSVQSLSFSPPHEGVRGRERGQRSHLRGGREESTAERQQQQQQVEQRPIAHRQRKGERAEKLEQQELHPLAQIEWERERARVARQRRASCLLFVARALMIAVAAAAWSLIADRGTRAAHGYGDRQRGTGRRGRREREAAYFSSRCWNSQSNTSHSTSRAVNW